MSNKQTFTWARWCLAVGIAVAAPVAQSEWLSTFGTGGQESSSGLFETVRGDYVLLGEITTPATPLVAGVDAAGTLRWSKRLSAKWSVFPGTPDDPDAPVFFGPRREDTSQFAWTRIGFDPSTGTPTIRYSKGFSSTVSGSFDVISAKVPAGAAGENFIAGILNLPSGANPQQARDVLVAKLAADGSIAWSQVLNFGTPSTANPVVTNRPVVLKLADGYLVSWSVTVHQLLVVNRLPQGINGVVVAKFDTSGNPITSSFKFFETRYESQQTQNSEVNDWVVLPGNRVLLGGKYAANPSQFFLALFDGNLNLQWAKTYADPSSLARLELVKIDALADATPYVQLDRTLTDQAGTDQETHAVQLQLSALDGSPTAQRLVQIGQFDQLGFSRETATSLLMAGSYAASTTTRTSAFFGRFETGNLQPVWGKTLLGGASDRALIASDAKSTGYHLAGRAQSYGVGQGDMLAGVLDASGGVGACENLSDVAPRVTNQTVTITSATLSSSLNDATVAIKTPLTAANTLVQPSIADANLIQTKVCEQPGAATGGVTVSPAIFGSKSKLTIAGPGGFGTKKGRVFVGRKRALVQSWSDNQIVILPRTGKAGTYTVRIVPKGKSAVSAPAVQLALPILYGVNLDSGKRGTVISVSGRYFGAGRPRVGFKIGQKRKFVRALPGSSDSTLGVRVPRLRPGAYQLEVRTDAGTGSSVPLTFTVR